MKMQSILNRLFPGCFVNYWKSAIYWFPVCLIQKW